ncbi:MAG: hypothetical protein CMM87_05405, partial [Rickettsiales bacterium]|nr:hypothetical protein [Rickettsiales bacterium]
MYRYVAVLLTPVQSAGCWLVDAVLLPLLLRSCATYNQQRIRVLGSAFSAMRRTSADFDLAHRVAHLETVAQSRDRCSRAQMRLLGRQMREMVSMALASFEEIGARLDAIERRLGGTTQQGQR